MIECLCSGKLFRTPELKTGQNEIFNTSLEHDSHDSP